MKTKTTKKEIKNRYTHILNIDADLIHNLLYFNPAFAYCTRVEGWACDFYEVKNNICLSSGYSPIGKSVNRDLQRFYEDKAKKTLQSKFFKTETKQRKVNELLLKFVNEVIK